MSTDMLLPQATSPRGAYTYMLSGLHTRSDIPLSCVPALVRDEEHASVLIQIATGESPIAKSNKRFGWVWFEHSTERSRLSIAGVADFEVLRGQKVLIWPESGAAVKDIELAVFGIVWATLLHQRGILPLHASAIATPEGIVAFAGHPGAGKSTTAAAMISRESELVTDDILPISLNQDGDPGAWPYLRRLKLKQDAITRLGLASIEPVSEALDKRKYFVYPGLDAEDRWRRLDQIYLLEVDPELAKVCIEPIVGMDAIRALIDQTYHFPYIREKKLLREHLEFCVQLASKIRVYRVRRPPSSKVRYELTKLISANIDEKPFSLAKRSR